MLAVPTGMPTTDNLYTVDFVETLKKKHAAGTYKEMVELSLNSLYCSPCSSF